MRSSIPVIIEILEASSEPLRVRQILFRTNRTLSRAQQPEKSIARDLSMELNENPNTRLIRVSRGLYTVRPQ